jgi:phosphoribosylaminoimidazole-succinocarboxamide synthase
MSSIITKGYGVCKEAIITKGYGRRIEKAVVDAIEEITRRRVSGSGTKRKRTIEEDEVCDEYTISVSLTKLNDDSLLEPIRNNITKRIGDFDVKISVKNISITKP